MKKNIIISLIILGATNITFSMDNTNNIDKSVLRKKIKSNVYNAFIYEMGLIIPDNYNFSPMAQNNIILEKDLKNLHTNLFNGGISWKNAQKQLDTFCITWE